MLVSRQIQAVYVLTDDSLDVVFVTGDNILAMQELAIYSGRSQKGFRQPINMRLGTTVEHALVFNGLIYRPKRFQRDWEVVTYQKRTGDSTFQGYDVEKYGIVTAVKDGGKMYMRYKERQQKQATIPGIATPTIDTRL